MTPARLRLLVVLLVSSPIALTGCSRDLGASGAQGYVDGTGVIRLLPVAERRAPGPIEGRTLEGKQVSLREYAGKVVVLNVWGSWCPPCRAEADDLGRAARRLAPKGVVFLGINTRDASRDNALAFQRNREVPYPSLYDPSGRSLLAFRGTLTPSSIPSTVVIDAKGRVAASILGEVTSVQTLVDLVQDASR